MPAVPPGFDEETHERGNGCRKGPIALQLAEQLNHTDHLAARLLDSAQCRFVRGDRSSAHGVCHDIALVQRIERRKGQAGLGPQRRHDQLLSSRCLHGSAKLDVFPGIDGGAIIGWHKTYMNCDQQIAYWRICANF